MSDTDRLTIHEMRPRPLRRGEAPRIGVEIVGFGYIDDDGEERLHKTAAAMAEARAGASDRQLRGLMELTPAGRLYLAGDGGTAGIGQQPGLCTDRPPDRRMVHAGGDASPIDAILFDDHFQAGPAEGYAV